MSFSFGFSGDDIEDDDGDVPDADTALATDMSRQAISDADHANVTAVPPRRHTFDELVSWHGENNLLPSTC
jgi:hypothetical protein